MPSQSTLNYLRGKNGNVKSFFISEYKKTKRNSRLDAISFMHVVLDHLPCWVESPLAVNVFLETKK